MSVVEIIKHYQRSIDKCAGNEERILHCITKLYHLPITVQHLQETGIGRTVNSLRKYDGECGDAAKACVAKWKAVVAAEESSDGEPEEQPEPVEETEPVVKVKHRVEHQSKKLKEDNHSSSKRLKDDVRQKIKEGNGIVNKSRHETNYHSDSQSHGLHTAREVVSQKNKVSVDKRDDKKHRGDKADSSSSDSSSKKIESSSDRKHKQDKYVSSKPSSSSSGKEKLEAKENREDRGSSGKKHKEHGEQSGQTGSRSNNESKHQSSSSHKYSDDRSREKKSHREDSRPSTKKISSKREERTKPKKSDEEAVGNTSKKRSRVMAEVSDDSSDESMELTKLNDKTKNRKNNSSPTFSPFSNSPTADGGIDCLSGASFAEALGMISPAKRRSPNTTHKTSSSSGKSTGSSSMGTPNKKKPTSSPMEFDFLSTSSPDLKLDASDMELPDINPNYRPMPNPFNPFDSPPSKKCSMAEDAVLEHLMSKNSTKTQRMKVFSGVKTSGSWKSVPTLFDICVRVLQENIDALEYTGGIPYDILKPVLKHASPDQLFMLEHYNPYLLEDTDSLWSYHINRHFKSKVRLEMETAREMYMRCLDEREAKFNTLRQSIKESQAKSVPVRQTKMAYVDNNYVKPPRNVARQQAKNGVSGRIVPKGVPSSPASSAPSRPPPNPSSSTAKQKPRLAPLMQKTMKFAKTFKR